MSIKRKFHQGLSQLADKWPALSDKLVASFNPMEMTSIPWSPATNPLKRSKVALVTTAGVHHSGQKPFDMEDSNGDPTFRIIDPHTIEDDYKITHDYYNHRDADRDLNVVFPMTRLKEMRAAGCIGAISEIHFSFMGHIDGSHVQMLINRTAPQIARVFKQLEVDVVLLTPA